MGRKRKTKTIKCKNCGKEFRVKKSTRRRNFCSKKCKKNYEMFYYRMNNTPYIKKLKDKINYDPSTTYMSWQDERYNENIGDKRLCYSLKKKDNELWSSYHRRLCEIIKKTKY